MTRPHWDLIAHDHQAVEVEPDCANCVDCDRSTFTHVSPPVKLTTVEFAKFADRVVTAPESIAMLALLGSCAAPQVADPGMSWVPAPAPTASAGPLAIASPVPSRFRAPSSGCTFARSLGPSCGSCVQDRCCDPPMAYSKALESSLACRKRCREMLPAQSPPLSQEERVMVQETCVEQCNDVHPDREEPWWHKANSLWHASREYAQHRAACDALSRTLSAKHSPDRLREMQFEYELAASALLALRHAAEAYRKTRPELA